MTKLIKNKLMLIGFGVTTPSLIYAPLTGLGITTPSLIHPSLIHTPTEGPKEYKATEPTQLIKILQEYKRIKSEITNLIQTLNKNIQTHSKEQTKINNILEDKVIKNTKDQIQKKLDNLIKNEQKIEQTTKEQNNTLIHIMLRKICATSTTEKDIINEKLKLTQVKINTMDKMNLENIENMIHTLASILNHLTLSIKYLNEAKSELELNQINSQAIISLINEYNNLKTQTLTYSTLAYAQKTTLEETTENPMIQRDKILQSIQDYATQ